MFGSPRLVRTMSVAPHGPGFRPPATLFRWLPLRACALPLALAAVALPAHASHHANARPSARAAVPVTTRHAAVPVRTAHALARSRPVERTVATVRNYGRHTDAVAVPVSTRRGARRGKAAAERPLSRRERMEAAAAEREAERAEALHALQQRASRYNAGTRASTHTFAKVEAAPVRAALADKDRGVDRGADRHIEDRVHAWYRSNHPSIPADEADLSPHAAPAHTTSVSQPTAASEVQPDLSTSARKATSADFARAAAVQRQTLTAAREQQLHQTTANDDDADAESRIPSTAPTEREPAPFVHGSFGVDSPSTAAESPVPANRAERLPAPIVRQAPASPVIAVAPPQRVDLKHRGDGLNTALAADAAGALNIPVISAADSSPRAVRALAAEVAASSTPRLKLPAPPLAALHKEAPAIAAVQSAAKRKDLDPAVASGMAEETFDDDDAPATARTAVALAGPAIPAAVQRGRTVADDLDSYGTPAAVLPVNLFDREGRLISVPPMKGSHEILVHQNQMAVSDGLDRIQDDSDLLDLRRRKLLVALPDEESTYPDDRLPTNRRFARPWTVRFIRDIARAHYTRFGTPLIITSAVRTVEFQRRLVRVNGNAAPPTGDIASPHLYGQAIDIAKGHMSVTEIMWMRAYLTPIENDGKIDVEEEFQQACFHMSVYRRYLGLPAPRQTPAEQLQRPLLTATATPVPQATRPEKKRRRLSTAMLATGLR